MFTKARTVTALFFVTVAASLAVSLGLASPAGATMRICKATICVAGANSCWLTATDPDGQSVELIFDEGDVIISAHGQYLVCKGGQWVAAAPAPTAGVRAPSSGQATTRTPVFVVPTSGQILLGH